MPKKNRDFTEYDQDITEMKRKPLEELYTDLRGLSKGMGRKLGKVKKELEEVKKHCLRLEKRGIEYRKEIASLNLKH